MDLLDLKNGLARNTCDVFIEVSSNFPILLSQPPDKSGKIKSRLLLLDSDDPINSLP